MSAVGTATRLLSKDRVNAYERVDPGNAKCARFPRTCSSAGHSGSHGSHRRSPYYELSGAYAEEGLRHFTKRLVFSAWNIVPKAISSVLSEAERRLLESSGTHRRYDAARQTGLLNFARSGDRLTGMPVLALLYPSAALAMAGDPLYVARVVNQPLPLARETMATEVRSQVERLLADLPKGPLARPTTLGTGLPRYSLTR